MRFKPEKEEANTGPISFARGSVGICLTADRIKSSWFNVNSVKSSSILVNIYCSKVSTFDSGNLESTFGNYKVESTSRKVV